MGSEGSGWGLGRRGSSQRLPEGEGARSLPSTGVSGWNLPDTEGSAHSLPDAGGNVQSLLEQEGSVWEETTVLVCLAGGPRYARASAPGSAGARGPQVGVGRGPRCAVRQGGSGRHRGTRGAGGVREIGMAAVTPCHRTTPATTTRGRSLAAAAVAAPGRGQDRGARRSRECGCVERIRSGNARSEGARGSW